MRIGRRSLLRATLGLLISGIAIVILIRSVDLEAAFEVLTGADPLWVVVMIVATLLDVGARAARWRALLAPIKVVRYLRVLGYTYIGYLANSVLPARLGELVRSHALGENEGVSRTTVLGTVVVERIVDTAFVVALAAVAVLVLSARGVMTSAVLLGAAFVGLLVLGLALAMALHRLPGADRVAAFLERWPRIVELGRRLRDGLAVAGKPRTLTAAIGISTLAWAASMTTYLAGGQAVGVELTIAEAALVCAGVALVTIVPSGPGYVGTFELTAVSIMSTFGVDRDSAFAMALLVHLVIIGVAVIGGVISSLRLGVGIGRPDENEDGDESMHEPGPEREPEETAGDTTTPKTTETPAG
jgi:uncharacterized protein (TIRG00374 family)